MINFPEEIIVLIIKCLDNSSSINLIKTCKVFNEIGNKFGYLKYITYDHRQYSKINIFEYIKLVSKHEKSLKKLYVCNFFNPQNWFILEDKSKIEYYNCNFSYSI